METTKKKETNFSNWNDLYPKVVKEITQRESYKEQVVKDALTDRFKKILKGKDILIQNSCK